MVCMDAGRAADAMKARAEKTDEVDVQALAEMLACGWHSEVHVKSPASHQLKALLTARGQLVSVRTEPYGQIRGLLRPFRVKNSSRSGSKGFAEAVRTACQREDVLYAAVSALLADLEAIAVQIAALGRTVGGNRAGLSGLPPYHLGAQRRRGDGAGLHCDGVGSASLRAEARAGGVCRADAAALELRGAGRYQLDLTPVRRAVAALSLRGGELSVDDGATAIGVTQLGGY